MANKRKTKVFLSHSSKDKTFVRALDQLLRSVGISTFLDERDVKIGEDIPQWIFQGIDSATHFMYVISRYSIVSEWVSEELSFAKMKEKEQKGIFILPILIDNVDIPVAIRSKRYADLRESDYTQLKLSDPVIQTILDSVGVPLEKKKEATISIPSDLPIISCEMKWLDVSDRFDHKLRDEQKKFSPLVALKISNSTDFSTKVRIKGGARVLWGKDASFPTKEREVKIANDTFSNNNTLLIKPNDNVELIFDIETLCLEPCGYNYDEVTITLSSLYPKMKSYDPKRQSFSLTDPLYIEYQNLPQQVELSFTLSATGRKGAWFDLETYYFFHELRNSRELHRWHRIPEPIGPIE